LTRNGEQSSIQVVGNASGELANNRGAAIMKTSFLTAVAITFTLPAVAAHADPSGHITGLGGVFVTSKDPKALAAWYRDVLGIHLEPWGGAILRYDAPGIRP
jgi:hypothetical protein